MNHLLEQTGLQFFSWDWNPNFKTLGAEHALRYRDVMQKNFKWLIEEIVTVELGDEKYHLKASDHRELEDRLAMARVTGDLAAITEEIVSKKAEEYETISSMENEMRRWVDQWIPVPFVEAVDGMEEHTQAQLAPRVFIRKKEEGFQCTLCINTDAPIPGDLAGRQYRLAHSVESVLKFVDENHANITGRQGYLETLYYSDQNEKNQNKGKHIASYAGLIQALGFDVNSQMEFGPATGATCHVDCFIDLGNANTSVVLLEHDPNSDAFFSKCSSLELRNLSKPGEVHTGSFPSKVAFAKPSFSSGEGLQDDADFNWPSQVRIGHEADSIIQHLDFSSEAAGGPSFLSSPKRYLWDTQASKEEWRYSHGRTPRTQAPDAVNILGYTRDGILTQNRQQQTLDGAESLDIEWGQQHFSKSSINRFFFIEVFQHVLSQINSSHFRENNNDRQKKRRLRDVVVSCPTGMLQSEQVQLRKYAKDALAYLTNHPSFTLSGDAGDGWPAVEVHPSIKDVKMPFVQLGDREEWMYDEATTTQLLYLYDTLQHKFNRNVDSFSGSFQLKDNSIRIGVVDLGGGTCDIMVCDHRCSTHNDAVHCTPQPIFWDSWMRAGDDLRKKLIEEVFVPDLKKNLQENGNTNFNDALIQLLSEEVGGYDSQRIKLLRGFMQQVAFPISDLYFAKANSEKEEVLSFEDVFAELNVHPTLMDTFRARTGADLTKLQWTISPQKINQIAQDFFETQLHAISGIMSSLGCDLVLLSGGTFRMQALEDLYASFMGTLEHRIQNMNRWRPGKWHPFKNSEGQLKDIKTHVTLGSAIAFHAGHTKSLHGVSLNTDKLKTEISSTAINVWRNNAGLKEIILHAKQHEGRVIAQTLPLELEVSSVYSPNYQPKPAYVIQINKARLIDTLRAEGRNDEQIAIELDRKVTGIQAQCPLSIHLSRNEAEGFEDLNIIQVTDSEGNDVQSTSLQLIQRSLPDEEYWTEKGIELIHS